MLAGLLALIGLGFALGLRHGIDWDHIAAITDITSSTVTNKEAKGQVVAIAAGGPGINARVPIDTSNGKWSESQQGFFLATMYALGHASLVVALGLLAIWLGAILPDWIDPIMERIVGVTLLILGLYIFYSIWRYGRNFQLRSRWMLVFVLIGRGWNWLKQRLNGHPSDHQHDHSHEVAQYGWKAAFGIGVIHGVGAETGSQALLLASAAGATTAFTGTVLLLAFTAGLLASNSLVAVFSLVGFISSSAKRNVYLAVGILAGIFSVVVGVFFLTGRGAALPDLQDVINTIFGTVG
jgi:cytochrome c biogenesis protein CcdA